MNGSGPANTRPREEQKSADRGIDGRLYRTDREGRTKTVIISVKGGHVTASLNGGIVVGEEHSARRD